MNEIPTISVIIKTYNEEQGIAKTIASIRDSLATYPHEILVADSLSTDQTQQIALDLGVTVVSLVHAEERCCGVGHQLGYLHAQGEFLLLLDGDMQLAPGFVEQGMTFLHTHPDYAGVAGMVEMDEAVSYEFKSRKQRLHQIYPLGDCHHLAGGGLYRKSAIDQLGYLTNRNLHAYEEAELGMRLQKAGFKLHRLGVPYFHHTSYVMSTFALLKHRWRSRYLAASGELLRASWGTAHFMDAVNTVKNELIFTLYLLTVVVSMIALPWMWVGIAFLPLLAFFLLKAVKNCSVRDALLSIVNLSFFSAGMVRGLCSTLKNPRQAPDNQVIRGKE
ncbi:glycosyltransferase family 2 protein [Vibrio cincinnatiensis]|uniref:glycosyltransferase family 2 protein n=1 Tax=Vibrio cincinnatiensis TaxID=675 RepID=UPI001EDD1A14|nr:glycosyltransferase [Vibrio cincinnatiensis]MCG3733806.1 glycosyltransferase [Vibrio cincinnatiensis]MCG3736650.1 glycosyltransferase [Vibrio cincinnatiensis]MCG3740990.1 glycosyltransferase [Vibrio cincinnatiensis]MCG3744642.1 glycosyltransferase [Vibrio cincinnatiensis]MCG3747122.1 glycosyltransferase [Vibrio cincinnatiensis]